MRALEILAPAGGMECVYAAVRSGADAVYLGAKSFSARSSAHNFDDEQLREAVRYCHINGTAVHLACNTLVHDDEIRDALRLVEYACSIGVDALIMQDVGLISLVRKCAPDMPIHGSTQLSVHTRAGVESLYKLGLTRVVLSRELSKNEIEEIARDCPVELEVFVHGALCMSVSGQCYFSAMLGSRSGNRGACAQPCRLPFSYGGSGHALSLKDLSIVEHLRELNAVFSRSGFTDGYYTGKRGSDMFGIRSKENVIAADSRVFASIHEMYKNERRHIPVNFTLDICGEGSSLTVVDCDKNSFTAKGSMPEKAIKLPLDYDRCKKSISKTGGTPYIMQKLRCNICEGLTMPVSALNAMRTECLGGLSEIRGAARPVEFSSITISEVGTRENIKPKNYRVRFTDCDISDNFLDSELIYVPVNTDSKSLNDLMYRGFAVAVEIPRGMFGIENSIYSHLKRVKALGINEVLANNIGAVEMAKKLGMDIHGGFGLNLTNTESIRWAEDRGIIDAEVSFELTLEQISRLGGIMPLGIISMGRLPLMLARNCPAKCSGRNCEQCNKNKACIRDRKGIDFPLYCYGACVEILNSVPLVLSDRKNEIKGVEFEVLRFNVENSVEKEENLLLYKHNSTPKDGFTRGLYYRGVE